jgi:TonB family protein
MSHYLRESAGLPRHSTALGGIVGLHVLVVYLFATGLVIKAPPKPTVPMVVTVTETLIPHTEAPPPAGPILDTFEVQIPQAPTPVLVLPEDPTRDDGILVREGPIEPPSPPAATVTEAPAIHLVGQNRFPDSEDYYPSDLRRTGVEGAAVVQACVDEQGALRDNPVIERSSGNPRLDAGALNVARAGRYARSIQGATPVPNCFHVRIGFRIRNQP